MKSRTAVSLGVWLLASAALAERAKLPELRVPGATGVNIHFTDPKPGEMRMLADAGFKWVRMDFSWGGTEREKGKYDFAAYDRLLAALEPHGIRAYFILDYGNRHYDSGRSPQSDEARAAMAAWAAAAVAHFKGKGVAWEMWNEPNIGFWKPRPNVDDYAKLAIAVGKSVRAAAPDEIYVGAATSTVDLKFLEACFKEGLLEYWDAVSVHPYRQGDPETVGEEYRRLRLLIAKYAPKGKAVPILSGEWGYSAAWSNFDEARQAKYLPRELLTNLYNEVPLSIWYDWHDDGADPKEAEHNFGTVKHAYKKDGEPAYEAKGAYVAMKALAKQLGGFAYNKRLAVKRDADWVLLFDKGADVRLAVWTTAKDGAEVEIPASDGAFDVVSASGAAGTAVQAKDGRVVVRAGDSVQYLISRGGPNEGLRRAAAWPRVPLEVVIRAPDSLPAPFEGYVSRGADRTAHAATLAVGGVGTYRQETVAVVTNPLTSRLLPPTGDAVWVEVSNPSGEAFDGEVAMSTEGADPLPGAKSFPVKLAAGQTAAIVRGPAVESRPLYRFRYLVGQRRDGDGGRFALVSDYADVAFRPLAFARPTEDDAAAFKLEADGDLIVKSRHNFAAATPPEPLPTGGGTALKLSYDFDPGWKFLQVKPAKADAKIEGKPKALGLWVLGDGSNTLLRLRFVDAIGETFQPAGVKVDFKGWRFVTIPMDGTDAGHWGKGDGRVNYPIRWDTLLLLDNPSREKVAGEIYFAGVTLIE